MNVLAIGNSFSEDATRYLHDIARAGGSELEVVNLYISGCSLERHYRNMLGNKKEYGLQCNGHKTFFLVTLEDALLSRPWDVITLQQASHFSPFKDSYTPYLEALADYVRDCAPKAKLLIHQTWAYEDGSDRLYNKAGYDTAAHMLADILSAYEQAADLVNADGIIPSGELMMKLLSSGIPKVHRDTYHASYGLGRYALGLLWYRMLTGNTAAENAFRDFDAPVTAQEQQIVKSCVDAFQPLNL